MYKLIKFNYFDKFFDFLAMFSLILYINAIMLSESAMFYSLLPFSRIISIFIKSTFILIFLKDIYDFLRGKFSILEVLLYMCLGGIFLFSYIKSKEAMPLLILLYMIGVKNIDVKKTLKYVLYSQIVVYACILISSIFPFANGYNRIQTRYGVQKLRYTLGFFYPPIASNYFFSFSLLYILIKEKLTKIDIFFLSILNIILFYLTDTKAPFICVFVLIILYLISRTNFKSIIQKFAIVSYPLFAILIFTLSYFYTSNNVIYSKINSILTGRLGLSHNGFYNWGVSLFGQVTNMSNSDLNYNYVDPAYMQILFKSGVIILLITIVFYMIFSYIAYKNSNTILSIVLLSLSIHCIFDWQLIEISYNPFILFFPNLICKYLNDNKSYKNKIQSVDFNLFFEQFILITFITYIVCLQIKDSNVFTLNVVTHYIVSKLISLSFVCVFLKVFYDYLSSKFNIKEIIIYGVLFVILVFSYYKGRDAFPLLTLLYLIALKNINDRKFIKTCFIAMLSTYIVIILCHLLGIINDNVVEQVRYGITRARHSLGFSYTSTVAHYFLFIVLTYIVYKKNLKIYDYLIIMGVNILLFIITDTKIVFLCTIIVLITNAFITYTKFNIFKEFSSFLVMFSFPLGFLFILISASLYSNNILVLNKLNSIFTGRIALSAKGLSRYGISLFGDMLYKNNYLGDGSYFFIDSSYMMMIFNSGIIVTVLTIVFYMLFTYILRKRKDYAFISVLLIVSLNAILDNHILYLNYCPFILLFSTYFREYITKIIKS